MSVTVAPVSPADYEAVARLLFARLPATELDRRVGRFVGMIAAGELDPAGLLVAKQGADLLAAAVVQFLPGETAVVVPPYSEDLTPQPPLQRGEGETETLSTLERVASGASRVRSSSSPPLQAGGEGVLNALAAHIVALLRTRGALLGYTFLDPADAGQADPLVRHGFRSVTQITHMLRIGADARLPPKPSAAVHFTPARDDPAAFGQTLLATYDGTLDVPEACTNRPAEDILAGYRVNQPDPPYWWLARAADGTPVGVVMLTVTESAGVMDLGYLGLVPAARGKGAGSALLRYAVRTAHALGFPDVNLSVDSRNEPALRVYRAHSFRAYQWQQVFLWRPSW